MKPSTYYFRMKMNILTDFQICISVPLRYWAKLRQGYFRFPDFWSIPYKRKLSKLQNQLWYSHEIGPVTALDKKNKTMSKKFDEKYRKIVTSLSFFQFKADLEQSGSQIPDALSVKLIFSLKVTFYLTKTENRTKKSLTQLSQYCFE